MPSNPKLTKSRLEALMAMASSTVAEPVAGVAGLFGLLKGHENAARNVETARTALTYRPRDMTAMDELARLVQPVAEKLQQGRDYLGDAAYNRTGSPGAATAAYMVPDALLALVGARGLSGAGVKGGPSMAQMRQNLQAPQRSGRFGTGEVGALFPDRREFAEGIPVARDGADFATGEAVQFPYSRNTGGVRQHADPSAFGQMTEPFGRYVSVRDDRVPAPESDPRPGFAKWEIGVGQFERPLVVDADQWKAALSARYGGKTGKALTAAIRRDGFDGIVTRDKYGAGEVVDLSEQ